MMEKNSIRIARLLDGMSQLELAAKSGINFSTVSQIERGWRIPTQYQLNRLRRVLPKLDQVESLIKD